MVEGCFFRNDNSMKGATYVPKLLVLGKKEIFGFDNLMIGKPEKRGSTVVDIFINMKGGKFGA